MSKKNPYAPAKAGGGKRLAKAKSSTQEPSIVDGTIKEVLDAVGDDTEKAAEALKAEQAKENPRSTLVKSLTELAESDKED